MDISKITHIKPQTIRAHVTILKHQKIIKYVKYYKNQYCREPLIALPEWVKGNGDVLENRVPQKFKDEFKNKYKYLFE